jgi:hypothetical protein
MDVPVKINDAKDPLKIIFNNRQEALTWLRINGCVMQYIVIDVAGGCMLRVDETFKGAKK